MVLLQEGQGEVDARGDAGGGVGGAVPDEDRVRFDAGPGVAAGQQRRVLPVRRGAPAVEQARGPQQEGAGTDGRDPAGPGGECGGGAVRSGSMDSSGSRSPPTTRRVSKAGASATSASTGTRMPIDEDTGFPPSETTVRR